MKKIILMTGMLAGGLALPATVFANSWLLYLPAILAGSQGGGTIDPPVVTGALNDTGITDCTGNSGKEDCNYGRDANAETNSNDDGHAGFSFTKLDSSGEALDDQTQNYATDPWACVKDNVTGLVWSLDQGATAWEYIADKVTTANANELCGAATWRIPTIKELVSIVSYHTHSPAIDTGFFPIASEGTGYWSNTDVLGETKKWTVSIYGATAQSTTGSQLRFRLVHD